MQLRALFKWQKAFLGQQFFFFWFTVFWLEGFRCYSKVSLGKKFSPGRNLGLSHSLSLLGFSLPSRALSLSSLSPPPWVPLSPPFLSPHTVGHRQRVVMTRSGKRKIFVYLKQVSKSGGRPLQTSMCEVTQIPSNAYARQSPALPTR